MADSSTLVDRVKMFVESSGTGPFQLGNAVPSFRGSEALIDGLTYSYAVESGSDYEVGQGVYVLAVDQLLRAPTLSSAGGAPVNFPANVTINFTALAADLTAGLAGSGTVTSIQGSGGTTGLTLTGGPITGAGTLTIGGVLGVANGGTAGATEAEARAGIGLGNVDNTSDADKPVSTAVQDIFDNLADPAGGLMVGYIAPGTDSNPRTMQGRGRDYVSSQDYTSIQAGLDANTGKNFTLIGNNVVPAAVGVYGGQTIDGQADGAVSTATTNHHLIIAGLPGVAVKNISIVGVNGTTALNNSGIVFGSPTSTFGRVSNVELTGMSGSPIYITGGARDIDIEGVYTHGLTGTHQNQTDVMLSADSQRVSVRFNRLYGETYTGTGSLQGGFDHDILFNIVTGKRAYGIIDYDTTPVNSRMLILGNRVSEISGIVPSTEGGAGIYTAATGLQRIALNDVYRANLDTVSYGLAPAGIGNNAAPSPLLTLGNILRENKWHGRMVVTTTAIVSSVGEVFYENERDQFIVKNSSNALIVGASITALTAPGLAARGININVGDAAQSGVIISAGRIRGGLYGIDADNTDYSLVGNMVIDGRIPVRYQNATGVALTGLVLDSALGAFESLILMNMTYSTVADCVLRKNASTSFAITTTGTCTGLVINKSVVIDGSIDPMNLIDNQGTGCIVEMYGTAAPTSGTHQVGDRVVNRAPAVGQPKAWVCTTAGAPGTWTSEGNL